MRAIDLLSGVLRHFSSTPSLLRLQMELRDYFGVKHVFLLSSGKAALTLILEVLKQLSPRNQVVIPAYTCFSVPSAIVRAGLQVRLCDIHPKTLDFCIDGLEAVLGTDTLCVVATHLLGTPSDVEKIRRLCKERGIFVVEDAAQAMGVRSNGRLMGTSGDVGFFSLGRGKNVTCGSGGVIVTNNDAIAEALARASNTLPKIGMMRALLNLASALAMSVFVRPWLYWLPAGLPFLRLGETTFDPGFPIERMDGLRAGLLRHWRRRLEVANEARRLAAREILRRLGTRASMLPRADDQDVIFLRLPLLLEDRLAKDRLCALSKKHGLGISPLYPSGIARIPELQGRIKGGCMKGADVLADRLVTLPVHMFVTAADRNGIARAIEAVTKEMDRVRTSDPHEKLPAHPQREDSAAVSLALRVRE